ncbi:unnamed protein product [Caenorhabditis brenneri]
MKFLSFIFGISVLAPQFPITILDSYEPSFVNHFRILCYEQYTTFQLCIPDYERCRSSGPKPLECKNIFLNCTQSGPVHEYNEFCNDYPLNATSQLTTEAAWQKHLNETLNLKSTESPNEENCHISNQLFRKRNHNITNELIERMPSIASTFCPCGKRPDDGLSGIRFSKMGIPLHMWNGGFSSKMCWREMDRYLVENLGGASVALEINHIWAKYSDCLEDPDPRENCLDTFKASLKKSVNNSTIPNKCQLYYEMIVVYLPSYHSPPFDYRITYIDTSDLTYLHSYEYQEDRLYLVNSLGDSVFSTCFPNKREVSSCSYKFIKCNITNLLVSNITSEECGRELVVCLSEVEEKCKKVLLPKVDSFEFLEKLWQGVRSFANTVITDIAYKSRITFILWITFKILILLFDKISDILDKKRDRIEGKPNKNRNRSPESQKPEGSNPQIEPESKQNEKDPLIKEDGPGYIPKGEKFEGTKKANDNNETSGNVGAKLNEGVVNEENKEEEKKEEEKKEEEKKEEEKKEEEKKEELPFWKRFWKKFKNFWKNIGKSLWKSLDDSPVGRSFKKLCFSIIGFVSAVFNKFFRSQ